MIYNITDVDLIALLQGLYRSVLHSHLSVENSDELDVVEASILADKIKKGEFVDYHNGKRMKIDCVRRNGRLLFYSEDWLDDDTNKESYHNVMLSILGPKAVIRVSEYDVMPKDEADEVIDNRIWRVTNGTKDPDLN